MRTYFLNNAFLPDGWTRNVTVTVDEVGTIAAVAPNDRPPANTDGVEVIDAPVLPGLGNIHSSAYQRALVGLGDGGRDTAVRPGAIAALPLAKLTETIDPEGLQAIAAQTYVEMLKAGYTAVGEFHTLHNDVDGGSYADPTELSGRMIAAAQSAGIAITHLPVFRAQGGYGGEAPRGDSRRTIMSVDGYADLLSRLKRLERHSRDIRIGCAPDSLATVTPEDLSAVIGAAQGEDEMSPIHIPIARTFADVEACQAWCGQRPADWLLTHAPVDGRWCLIHATWMDRAEARATAASDAVVALCPTASAKRADGVFALTGYLEAGGKLGIGSDDNGQVDAAAEIRMLDYAQRLTRGDPLPVSDPAPPAAGSPGTSLFLRLLEGGAQALGRDFGKIQQGYRADFITLDPASPHVDAALSDRLIDTIIYAAPTLPVRDVMVGGVWRIRDGHHPSEGDILDRFRHTVRKLLP